MGDQVTFQLAQERPLSELYEIKLLQGDRGRPEGQREGFLFPNSQHPRFITD